jgi:hypothetical protein
MHESGSSSLAATGKRKVAACFAASVFFMTAAVSADEGFVIKRFRGCDYFIADGPRGLYVLEWYGGYDPSEGDRISGDIGSYGMKSIVYNGRSMGRVWVEDFLESTSSALEEIRDHC